MGREGRGGAVEKWNGQRMRARERESVSGRRCCWVGVEGGAASREMERVKEREREGRRSRGDVGAGRCSK